MKIQFWGTRGSLGSPGPETNKYGGNTSCIQIIGNEGGVLVLDAGTGLMQLGRSLPPGLKRIDLLLTHLHMDHIQGLGFFSALYNPGMTVHIWGPASTTLNLRARLVRYLSPPLFPVQFRDLPCKVELHHVPSKEVAIGEFQVSSWLVCHPGPTVGYRVAAGGKSVAYMPDHEPALGMRRWPASNDWISGFECAHRSSILIHDAQYTAEEYASRIGWGHSHITQTLTFAERAEVGKLVTFHHDPFHSDETLEKITSEAISNSGVQLPVEIAMERAVLQL